MIQKPVFGLALVGSLAAAEELSAGEAGRYFHRALEVNPLDPLAREELRKRQP